MVRLGLPRTRHAMQAILLAGTILASHPVLADSAATTALAPAAATTDALEGNEIIVTAQKRSETMQNVPISMQALSGAKLAQNNVVSFDDYAKMLPSVSYQDFAAPGQANIYFRGITSGSESNGSHSGSQPTSALYIDDIPLTTIAGAVDLHIYDMQRVEALSGPQGTLYGASSLSGTLRLITNKPVMDKFEGGIDVSGTTFGKGPNSSGGSIDAFINQPIGHNMALRVSAFYQRDGGYISNVPGTRTYEVNTPALDAAGNKTLANAQPITVNNAPFVKQNFNDVETVGGRAALGIDLDDNWTVTPSAIYQNQKAHGTFLYGPVAGTGNAVVPATGNLQVQDYSPDYSSDVWGLAALTVHGKISNWDLTYAGSYFTRHLDTVQDYSDYSVNYQTQNPSTFFYNDFFTSNCTTPTTTACNLNPGQIYHGHDDYSKMSHELRISSSATEPYRLTMGLFMERQTDHIFADYAVNGLASGSASNLALGAVPDCGDDVYCTRAYRVDRDYAGFADGSWDITHTLTLSGGIREFAARNTSEGFSGTAGNALAPGSTASLGKCVQGSGGIAPCTLFDKGVTAWGEVHRVNLSWKIDPSHMVYATYSTGYRPGGINRVYFVNNYLPDTLTNFEVGAKNSWFNHHLTANVAIFDEEWHNAQFEEVTPHTVGTLSIYNIGRARVQGAEGDFSANLGHISLSGSGAYMVPKTTSNICAIDPTTGNPNCATAGIATLAGEHLPIQPMFKGNLTARYHTRIGSAKAFVQASLNHQSGVRSALIDSYANAFGPIGGFSTVDLSLGEDLASWHWEAYITNALNDGGTLSINSVCIPSACSAMGRAYPTLPREFGIKLGKKF